MITALDGINIDQEFQSGLGDFGDPSVGSGDWQNHYPTTQVNNDLDYFWSLGVRKLRIAAGDLSSPMSGFRDERFAVHLNTCKLALQKGFHVEFGAPNKFGAKPSEWKFWYDNQLSYALQFQNLVDQYEGSGIWMIGNENEANFNLGRDAITSITRTSNVVTVVMPLPHSFANGDSIVLYNSASGVGSGNVIGINTNTFISNITVINETTFTFSNSGTDATSTTGWVQYSSDAVRKLMKRMATYLKANGITIPLSYSCIQGIESAQVDGYYIKSFVTLGRGDIDYLDLNVYGTQGFPSTNTLEAYFNSFKREIELGKAGFGVDHFRVTEWSGNGQTTSIKPASTYDLIRYQMKRFEYLQEQGITNYVFCYRQNAEGGAFPATKPHNTSVGQTWRSWWFPYIGGKQRQGTQERTFSVAGTHTSIASLRESPLTVVDSNMGMNIGQYQQSGAAHSSAHLDELWNLGVRKLRVASGDPDFSAGVTACRNLALAAKAMGFYVIFVFSGDDATDANWSTISDQITSFADWANTNGIDEINMCNELDYRQTTAGVLTNSVDKQIALATTLISTYPSLVISTAIAQSSMDYLGAPDGWIEQASAVNTLGLKITYNVYGDNGDFEQFKDRIDDLLAVYPDLRISEWNVNASWNAFPSSEVEQNARIQEKFDFLVLRNLEHYFFTWNWNHQNDQFSLKKADGTLRSWKNVLFENPTPRTAAGTRPVAIGRPTITIS